MKYSKWNRFGFKWNSGRQINTFLNHFMLESCFPQMKNHILSFEVVTSKVWTVKMFMAILKIYLKVTYFLLEQFFFNDIDISIAVESGRPTSFC